MARRGQPIPRLEPKRQSTMQLTRAEWNPNKPSPSGDALKTSFKCQLYGTDPIASLRRAMRLQGEVFTSVGWSRFCPSICAIGAICG
jgi:hypothetical protein